MISSPDKKQFEFVNITWLKIKDKIDLLYDFKSFRDAKEQGGFQSITVFVVAHPTLKSELFSELFGEFTIEARR